MRQQHKAGEHAFVDHSGKKPSVIDPNTGEEINVELFVAVLGASNLPYAQATPTQTVIDLVSPASSCRAGRPRRQPLLKLPKRGTARGTRLTREGPKK